MATGNFKFNLLDEILELINQTPEDTILLELKYQNCIKPSTPYIASTSKINFRIFLALI